MVSAIFFGVIFCAPMMDIQWILAKNGKLFNCKGIE